MIKYAHRGLVKDGKLPSVFYKLYLLISVVFYSLWLLLALIGFLFSHSDSLEEKVLKTFKGERNVWYGMVWYISLYVRYDLQWSLDLESFVYNFYSRRTQTFLLQS